MHAGMHESHPEHTRTDGSCPAQSAQLVQQDGPDVATADVGTRLDERIASLQFSCCMPIELCGAPESADLARPR